MTSDVLYMDNLTYTVGTQLCTLSFRHLDRYDKQMTADYNHNTLVLLNKQSQQLIFVRISAPSRNISLFMCQHLNIILPF